MKKCHLENKEAKTGAIVSHLGTKTETVQVRVHTEEGGSHIRHFMIDTGSDWTVIGPDNLTDFGLNRSNLSQPTVEMSNTATATGVKMSPQGYVNATFQFGDREIKSKMVVFKDVKTPLLAIDVLKSLGIVNIVTAFVQKSKPQVAQLAAVPSIVVPFGVADIYLNEKTQLFCNTTTGELHNVEQTKKQLLHEFEVVFESQSPMKGEKFKINLVAEAVPCCVTKARKIPVAYENALRSELDELLQEGIITPVTTPTEWVSAIVVEPKKDSTGQFNGKVRLCVDFRHLNKYCLREHFTTSSVLETIQSIHADDAKLFTTFDAWKGYHQIELEEKSKQLTTFITPFGRFRYERAPFGINSISEHYNRRMSEELHGLTNIQKVVDDNVVYTSNDLRSMCIR